MSNELIRSNVLFHNDHTGELTIVNLDSEAYIAEDCFPDELDVLPAEDLADLDNGALQDALDNDQNSAAHNVAEIVAESAQTTNSEMTVLLWKKETHAYASIGMQIEDVVTWTKTSLNRCVTNGWAASSLIAESGGTKYALG